MKKYDEADSALATALKITKGQGPAKFDVLFTMALKGQKEQVLGAINAWTNSGAVIDPMGPAALYAVLNMNDEAISWLEKAYEQRAFMMISLKLYWIWDGLRKDARFKEIYQHMNFPD